MENATYIGLSRQMVLRTGMSLVANNIANVSTPGYRGQNPLFTEYIADPKDAEDPISMVNDYGQYDVTAPGPLEVTGNELDAALVGPGFFGIQTPNGIQYTRAGNFTMNLERDLVTVGGLRVAGLGGGTINIPIDATDISIDEQGRVSTDQGEIGQIMIREFTNPQAVNPAGNGLYEDTGGGPVDPVNTRLVQGSIEGSNVQPVVEMARMIEVSREYQSIQRFIQNDHERQRTAIQRLGRPAN